MRFPPLAVALAAALGLTLERVSVKASTGNLQGPEGEGRAISAEVLATIESGGCPGATT